MRLTLYATVDPKDRAAAIIDALPGNSLVSKTGFITLGAGLATWLISKEIYVFNNETVLLVAFAGVATGLYRTLGTPILELAKQRGEVGPFLYFSSSRHSNHNAGNRRFATCSTKPENSTRLPSRPA